MSYHEHMPAISVKHQVIHALQRMPEDIDFRDVTEEVALLAAVAEAEEDIAGGDLVDNDRMRERIEGWANG